VASRERGLTVAAQREYVQVMRERYARAVGRAAKGAVLDEIERVLGWHRKHAIRALARVPLREPRVRRGRPRQYLACLNAIERVWETLDYCCAERLQPHLLRVAQDLVRCGELEAPTEVLEELGRISRATVARRIAELPRSKPRRPPVAPHPQRLLKTAVPTGRFAWDETRPGALEVDLVEHNDGSSSGHYAATLSVVDVVSGWSRRRAVLGKSQAVVHEALERLLNEWPTRVWGLHSDNGAEFLNNHLVRYCRRHAIEYHRSRAYRKNDNAWVFRIIRPPIPALSGRVFRRYPAAHSGRSRPPSPLGGRRVRQPSLVMASRVNGLRLLRMLSPRMSSRWALCTNRSRIASARVGSARYSCHAATGSWLVMSVEQVA